MSEGKEDTPHILNSVSKTFTSMAVGLAISEGRLALDEKLVDIQGRRVLLHQAI